METPMITHTPRTNEAAFTVYSAEDGKIHVTLASFSEKLETELTEALARISDLEKIKPVAEGLQRMLSAADHRCESLTRQLSEKDSKITELEKSLRDVTGFEPEELEAAEAHIAELKRQLSESQAQLASAREDSARLDWLEESVTPGCFGTYGHYNSASNVSGTDHFYDSERPYFIGELDRMIGKTLRSAIDSARGVTSPPAVSPGEKDAWQPIETAPKDGTKFLLLFMPSEDQCVGSWWPCGDYSKWRIDHVSGYEWEAITDELQPTHWQPLPPPPQGKERE